MSKFYDVRYKQRAIDYRKEGHTIEEMAKIFKIGTTVLKSWVKKHEEDGWVENKARKSSFKEIKQIDLEFI